MTRILLISHGQMATGMSDTLTLFFGENHRFDSIGTFTNGVENVEEEVTKYIESIGNDSLIICTDILGGSINQVVSKYVNRLKTYVIAGMNLPLILQISSLLDKDDISNEDIQNAINE